jgi:hypothetical protein
MVFALVVCAAGGLALLGLAIFAQESVAARATAAALGIVAILVGFFIWRHFSRRFALLAEVLTTRSGEVVRIEPKVAALRHLTVGGFGATYRDKTFCSGNFHLVLAGGAVAILRVANVSPEDFKKFREDLHSMFRDVQWEADKPLM